MEAARPLERVFVWRWVLAALLLGLEVWLFRAGYSTDAIRPEDGLWLGLVRSSQHASTLFLFVLGGWAVFAGRSCLETARSSFFSSPPRVLETLLRHGVALACFGSISHLMLQGAPPTGWYVPALVVAWGLSGLATLLTAAALILPVSEQAAWARKNAVRLVLGATIGVAAYAASIAIGRDMPFWWHLSTGTTWLADAFLSLVYDDRFLQLDRHIIGTPGFRVHVTRFCSGYAGIGLFTVFFGTFVVLLRSRFRFPSVLILLPVGVVTMYLLNGLRIALLVVIGTEVSPQVAMDGFHVNAGWPFFAAVALAFAWLASRVPAFARDPQAVAAPIGQDTGSVNVAAVYLGPLVAAVATVFVIDSFTVSPAMTRLARGLAICAIVALYWREYVRMFGRVVPAIWIHAASAALLWTALGELLASPASAQPPPAPHPLLGAMEVATYVLLAPLAEELAFRGFLLRRLVAADFESVDPRRAGWIPVVVSSALFGLLHDQWLAGALCGLVFASAYRHRGKLGDAVLVHGITNAMVLAYAYATGSWHVFS